MYLWGSFSHGPAEALMTSTGPLWACRRTFWEPGDQVALPTVLCRAALLARNGDLLSLKGQALTVTTVTAPSAGMGARQAPRAVPLPLPFTTCPGPWQADLWVLYPRNCLVLWPPVELAVAGAGDQSGGEGWGLVQKQKDPPGLSGDPSLSHRSWYGHIIGTQPPSPCSSFHQQRCFPLLALSRPHCFCLLPSLCVF